MVATDETRNLAAPGAAAGAHVRQAGAGPRWGLTRLRRMRRWPRRSLIALIYVPAVALLFVGAAAVVGLLGDLWWLAHAFGTHALDTVPTTYDRLALSGRMGLVSGAFLVLLCALVVVAVGCRGRRRWRLYLIPGVPLSAAAALLFVFAVQWSMLAINQGLGWPRGVWETLTALALADAVLVAARVSGIGAGPLGTRRAYLRNRLRGGHTTGPHLSWRPALRQSRQTRPIPVVRFGPRDTGIPTPDLPAGASDAVTSGTADAPTAEELRAAAEVEPPAISDGTRSAAGAA